MVQAVRDGEPLREVARRFGVSPGNVSFWVERCKGKRLDRCDFEEKVWQRFYFADLAALQSHSSLYVQAHRARTAKRREAAPERRAFPKAWHFDLGRNLSGTLIYLRRTDAKGNVHLLGHRFTVDRLWLHRLVRCEVHFDLQCVRCYGLRRRDPADQPLLAGTSYQHPNKPFKGTK